MIKDNLLRRHLTTEQRYIFFAKLSEIYEKGRGGSNIEKGKKGFQPVEEAKNASNIEIEDVLEK